MSGATLRVWLETRPRARYAVTAVFFVAIAIAFQEILRFLRPSTALWVTMILAPCFIAYGVFLAIERIRRPLLDEEKGTLWSGAMFIAVGTLSLIFKFASE